MNSTKVGFVGTGNMGGALAIAVAKAGYEVYLSSHSPLKAEQIKKSCSNAHVVSNREILQICDYVYIGVKPQMLDTLVEELNSYEVSPSPIYVSMLAGVDISTLTVKLGDKIIRIMPNTPVKVGEGMTTYAISDNVDEEELNIWCDMMRYSGKIDMVDESLIDATTVIAGCSPAYAYYFANALVDAGVEIGLDLSKAKKYVAQMLKGVSAMITASEDSPLKLMQDVCSKGGATIRGVDVLTSEKFDDIVNIAVKSSFERTKELSKTVKND